jgi:uracil-DNA glycosylase
MFALSEIDSSWHRVFTPHLSEINAILDSIDNDEITPSRHLIFKSFKLPLPEVKILILGQDPYPTSGVADGLAFSSGRSDLVPESLRNIFNEYCNDLGYPKPNTSSLENWAREGVLLLNTALTTEIGERDKHKLLGWKNLISSIIADLSTRNVVAILWGNSAKSLGSAFTHRIESAHPSPLSARRGFIGSKPFTRANDALKRLGSEEVNWKLP